MALIDCPECNKKRISDKAPACPGCGAPISELKHAADQEMLKNKSLYILAGLLFVLCVIVSVNSYNKPEERPKTAADIRKDQLKKCFSSWDGSHRNLERVVKESMNDESSYDHTKTVYRDNGDHLIVTTTFIGKNAFGGTVKNSVIAKTGLDCSVIEVISQ